jgi:hypothetical protein
MNYVRFEVFTAMTMKNTVFWDVAQCRYFVNRRFGGTRRLGVSDGHSVYSYLLTLVHCSWISSTLKMGAIRSSETSVNKMPIRRHIPEDGILHTMYYFVQLLSILQHTKNTIIVISGHYPSSCNYLKHTTFRRLDSVSVFRWNLLSWSQSIQLVPIRRR